MSAQTFVDVGHHEAESMDEEEDEKVRRNGQDIMMAPSFDKEH